MQKATRLFGRWRGGGGNDDARSWRALRKHESDKAKARVQYSIRAGKRCESQRDVGKQETQDVVESMRRREQENCKKGW